MVSSSRLDSADLGTYKVLAYHVTLVQFTAYDYFFGEVRDNGHCTHVSVVSQLFNPSQLPTVVLMLAGARRRFDS